MHRGALTFAHWLLVQPLRAEVLLVVAFMLIYAHMNKMLVYACMNMLASICVATSRTGAFEHASWSSVRQSQTRRMAHHGNVVLR